jgi:hypothetical protein
MVTDPRETVARVVFASQLVKLAAALETARAVQNGLARAALELRQLAEEAVEHSARPGNRM